MKKIGIITNVDKDRDFAYTRLLAESIKRHGGSPMMTDVLSEASSSGAPCRSGQDLIDACDYLFALEATVLFESRKEGLQEPDPDNGHQPRKPGIPD